MRRCLVGNSFQESTTTIKKKVFKHHYQENFAQQARLIRSLTDAPPIVSRRNRERRKTSECQLINWRRMNKHC